MKAESVSPRPGCRRRRGVCLLLAALLSVLLALPALAGCSSPKHTAEELRPILEELLPKSAELNEIYFGKGLPITQDEDAVRAFYASFDTDVTALSYAPVDTACGYENVDDIKRATLEVFSENYAGFLFDRAFTGISDTFDEGLETEHRETALYAMYLEQDGYLTKRLDIEKDALHLGRTFDLDSLTVLRENKTGVQVLLKSFLDGAPSMDVEIWLVETETGWRLDSPTY